MSFTYVPVIFAIGLLLIFVNRRNNRWIVAPLFFVFVVCFSCQKHQPDEFFNASEHLFVKIEQVDKDGKRSSTSIIKVDKD